MFNAWKQYRLIVLALASLLFIALAVAAPAAADDPAQEATAVPLIKPPGNELPDSQGGDVLAPPGNDDVTEIPGPGGQKPNQPPSSPGDAGTSGEGDPGDSGGSGSSGGSGDSGGTGNSGGTGSSGGSGRPSRPSSSSDDSGFLCFSPALALVALGAVGLFDRRLLRKRR